MISNLFESIDTLCFFGMKFGLHFCLDPSKQGTRGPFFRSKMPLDALDLPHCGLDAVWVHGAASCGWPIGKAASDFEVKWLVPGSWRVIRERRANVRRIKP